MKFLINGANFQNKGAQAMLFITTSELLARFPGAEILFRTNEKPEKGYQFRYFHSANGWQYVKGGKSAVRVMFRVLYYKILGHKATYKEIHEFKKELCTVDAMIDISGYSLSSQRGEARSRAYLDQIRIAKRYNIPYFIMPQSIGPFDYGEKQNQMDKLLKRYLPYPIKIFPREEEGYNLLTKDYGLKNVEQSYDLVLQNKKIILENVINEKYKKFTPIFESTGNVAIVPNERNFAYGSKERYTDLYRQLIRRLQKHNKTVYLVRHSEEDLEACHMIFDGLENRQGVFLLEDDFDCLQFNGIVQQMDYIIGSRYHGIVHSLKNSVPALVLGWATKYQVLLRMFNQERFLFDVRGDIDIEALLGAVDDMESSWQREKQVIRSKLGDYQHENCFDCISEYFKK